jgi:hypothetical protein
MCFHPRALDKKEGDVDQKLDEIAISITQLQSCMNMLITMRA